MAFYGKALVLNCELPAACILDPSGFGLPLQGLASDLSWHEQCLVGRQLALAVVFYSFRVFFQDQPTVAKTVTARYKVRILGYKMGETTCDWIRTS